MTKYRKKEKTKLAQFSVFFRVKTYEHVIGQLLKIDRVSVGACNTLAIIRITRYIREI